MIATPKRNRTSRRATKQTPQPSYSPDLQATLRSLQLVLDADADQLDSAIGYLDVVLQRTRSADGRKGM